MNAVFLDTVGLIGLWNHSDQWHLAAEQAYTELRRSRATLVTTRYVLLECGNAAARTSIRTDVVRLRRALEQAGSLLSPTDEDWRKAWVAYERLTGDNVGIVDHVSFIVMRRLGIQHAFTNDRHFESAGFETLF